MKLFYMFLLPFAVLAIVLVGSISVLNARTSSSIARGEYITNRVAQCPHCHTPRNMNNELNSKRWLAGAPIMMKPTTLVTNWASYAPNLTPSGFLSNWTDTQVVKLLMTGKDPSGREANPPMPPYRLNREDALTVTDYLRTLQAEK